MITDDDVSISDHKKRATTYKSEIRGWTQFLFLSLPPSGEVAPRGRTKKLLGKKKSR